MARIAATVEQSDDGSWLASVVDTYAVFGTGTTRDEALNDLRRGISGLQQYLRERGEHVARPTAETLMIDV